MDRCVCCTYSTHLQVIQLLLVLRLGFLPFLLQMLQVHTHLWQLTYDHISMRCQQHTKTHITAPSINAHLTALVVIHGVDNHRHIYMEPSSFNTVDHTLHKGPWCPLHPYKQPAYLHSHMLCNSSYIELAVLLMTLPGAYVSKTANRSASSAQSR